MTNKISGRSLALKALVTIENQGAYANRILNSLFLQYQPEEREKGLATDIVYGTLRNFTLVDYLLNQLLTKNLSGLPPEIRNILRLAMYQLITTPQQDYAVVNEAVKLTRKTKFTGFSGLVNAVLREYLRNKEGLALPQFEQKSIEHMTIVHSHPLWLVEKWIRRWGLEATHQLVEANNSLAPFTIRTNTLLLSKEKLLKQLVAVGIEAAPSEFVPEAIRLKAGRKLTTTPFWAAGYFYIQDEASMLVSYLLSPQPGEVIADLCAAPGGKTTHLAQLMKNTGLIYALDQYPHKTCLIQENAHRLKIKVIQTLTADARCWHPDRLLDAVLLDAPCTGTGVLRRRPDIRWRRTREELKELTVLQGELLAHAASLLKPQGRVVYSTCSLESEENEEQISQFLSSHPDFKVSIPEKFASQLDHHQLPEGILILPRQEETDGFFMTRLVKVS